VALVLLELPAARSKASDAQLLPLEPVLVQLTPEPCNLPDRLALCQRIGLFCWKETIAHATQGVVMAGC